MTLSLSSWQRWALGAGAVALALLACWMLIRAYGSARYDAGAAAERARWESARATAERAVADARVAAERRVTEAQAAYADRITSIEPIIVRSTDTVTRYAQTPAGSAPCLDAERVRGIDADAAALGLYPAVPATGGDTAVHADGD